MPIIIQLMFILKLVHSNTHHLNLGLRYQRCAQIMELSYSSYDQHQEPILRRDEIVMYSCRYQKDTWIDAEIRTVC